MLLMSYTTTMTALKTQNIGQWFYETLKTCGIYSLIVYKENLNAKYHKEIFLEDWDWKS